MDKEDPKQQQTSDYSKESFTTLISIVLIIIFFVTKNMNDKEDSFIEFLGILGFLFLQIMVTGIQVSLTIFSWMSKNESAKTIYMIISIVIIGGVLFVLSSIQ
jgi:heme/copper-type cytochrome/quinol oxidase subunit 4